MFEVDQGCLDCTAMKAEVKKTRAEAKSASFAGLPLGNLVGIGSSYGKVFYIKEGENGTYTKVQVEPNAHKDVFFRVAWKITF